MDGDKRAETCRRQAQLCLELAEHMSLSEDRARLMEMAQRWQMLARQAETEDKKA